MCHGARRDGKSRDIIRGIPKAERRMKVQSTMRKGALAVSFFLLGLAVGAPAVRALPGDRTEEEDRQPCARPPSPGQARPMIVRYYAREGEWAGQYIIREIAQMRFTRPRRDAVEAHVRYLYHCIIDRCGGGLDDGYDQRIFYFECRGDRWRVVRMGGYMSAQL